MLLGFFSLLHVQLHNVDGSLSQLYQVHGLFDEHEWECNDGDHLPQAIAQHHDRSDFEVAQVKAQKEDLIKETEHAQDCSVCVVEPQKIVLLLSADGFMTGQAACQRATCADDVKRRGEEMQKAVMR